MPKSSLPSALITGGAGFIGSQIVRQFRKAGYRVTVFDALTYAGFYHNIDDVISVDDDVVFFKGDLRALEDVVSCFQMRGPFDVVVHAAAESSVDRSIKGYEDFVSTNVCGSANLFQVCRETGVKKVINFGTDEVYGHFEPGETGSFDESSPLLPRNIYSASKAAQMHVARAFHITHGVPILSVCPSNCYGPRQHAEKLIPRIIHGVVSGEEIPIYNGGRNVREWLHVQDAADAIVLLAKDGKPGEIYNVSGGAEATVMEIYDAICGILVSHGGVVDRQRITQKPARPGDDHRYSVSSAKLRALGWKPEISLSNGLASTVGWYMSPAGRAFLSYAARRIS